MADQRAVFARRARLVRAKAADACLVLVLVGLWLGGILLAALGLVLLVGIVVADGHPARFFLHAQNIASHYLAADAAARLRFEYQIAGFYVGIVALLVIARGPSFGRHLRTELARGRSHV